MDAQKLIIANWKENPATRKEAEDLFLATREAAATGKAQVAVCPPFVYLSVLKGLPIGAQDVSADAGGPHTGAVSVAMLRDLGVTYVIVGHSERRKIGETDQGINKKLRLVLGQGLTPILCVGESRQERDAGQANAAVEHQTLAGLAGVEDRKKVIIAYEPVWSIGTGNNCPPQEAQESIDFIRQLTKNESRVLYGGSVGAANAGAYLAHGLADGLLVGAASLQAKEFAGIIRAAR